MSKNVNFSVKEIVNFLEHKDWSSCDSDSVVDNPNIPMYQC